MTIGLTQRRVPKPEPEAGHVATRNLLIRCGMEALTEHGFAAAGLDAMLRRATVPKGSFYHYFGSKADFGREVLKAYDAFFSHKLQRALTNEKLTPFERIKAFVGDAQAGMAKYRYTRGCLVGNLTQEVEGLPDDYRSALDLILRGWEQQVARCLQIAQEAGELDPAADCDGLARFFWIGWEGAVMRARLVRNGGPLDTFIAGFLSGLPRPPHPHAANRKKS